MSHYAVFLKGSEDGDPVYKNYDRQAYRDGEIVAVFGGDYEAAKWFAANFKGYSENGVFEVCGVHQSAQVGQDSNTFWRDQLPKEIGDAWMKYGRRIEAANRAARGE